MINLLSSFILLFLAIGAYEGGGKSELDSKIQEAVIYAHACEIYEVKKGVIPSEKQQADESYFKGFKINMTYTLSEEDLNRLKHSLLLKESYAQEYKRSCYFTPNLAIFIEGSEDNDPVYILFSNSCRKIFVSTSPGYYSGKEGDYYDLTSDGFELINDLHMSIKLPFEEFDEEDDLTGSRTYKDDFWRQVKLINSYMKAGQSEKLKVLDRTHTVMIMDSLRIENGKVDKMNILIKKKQGIDPETFPDLVREAGQMMLLKAIQEGKVKAVFAPRRAGVIDGVPPPNSSPSQIATYYLNQIEGIIGQNESLQTKYSLEKYKAYETQKNVTQVTKKISFRKRFIHFLKSKI